jgi:hypothetical protein
MVFAGLLCTFDTTVGIFKEQWLLFTAILFSHGVVS